MSWPCSASNSQLAVPTHLNGLQWGRWLGWWTKKSEVLGDSPLKPNRPVKLLQPITKHFDSMENCREICPTGTYLTWWRIFCWMDRTPTSFWYLQPMFPANLQVLPLMLGKPLSSTCTYLFLYSMWMHTRSRRKMLICAHWQLSRFKKVISHLWSY